MPTNFDIQNGVLNGPNSAYTSAYQGQLDKQKQQSQQDAALAQLIKGKQLEADNASQAAIQGQQLKQQGSAYDLGLAQDANAAAHRQGGKTSVKVGDATLLDQEYNPNTLQSKQLGLDRKDAAALAKERAKSTGWDSASDDLEALTNRDKKGGILTNPDAQLISTGRLKSAIPGSMMGLAELTGIAPKGSTEESKALQRFINEYSKAMSGVRLPPEAAARNKQALGYVSSSDPELVKKGIQSMGEMMRLKHQTEDSGYDPSVVNTVNSRMPGGSPSNRYSKIPAVQAAGTPQAGSQQAPGIGLDQSAIQAEIARRQKAKSGQ